MPKIKRRKQSAISQIPCICCGKILKSAHGNNKTKCNECGSTTPCSLDRDMIMEGGVNRFDLGYGSSHDGHYYLIGICDDCIAKKIVEKRMIFMGGYGTGIITEKKEIARMKWFLSEQKKKKKQTPKK